MILFMQPRKLLSALVQLSTTGQQLPPCVATMPFDGAHGGPVPGGVTAHGGPSGPLQFGRLEAALGCHVPLKCLRRNPLRSNLDLLSISLAPMDTSTPVGGQSAAKKI
jgi:hypothetical protein